MTSQTTRILADTSIWVDYFRVLSTGLQPLLQREQVVTHPLVLGEMFMGGFADRPGKLEQLSAGSTISPAPPTTRYLISSNPETPRSWVSFLDAHLLSAALILPVRLWTLDRRLRKAAEEIGAAVV